VQTKKYSKKYSFLYILLLSGLWNIKIVGRSIHRPAYTKRPLLEATWHKDNKKRYCIRSCQLQEEPLFKLFDKDFFYSRMFPQKVEYRYEKGKFCHRQTLNLLLEQLLQEIAEKKRKYTHFHILRKSNFNRRKKSGLLIVKFKEYPFVVKLFMENPKSFVRPYSKGVYPIFFFNMGGGVNRHLMGFTRIKNLEEMRKRIQQDPTWSQMIEAPRKWFWLPKDPQDIQLVGKNIGGKNHLETVIPGTYCIIADAIRLKDTTFSLFDSKARKVCMSLCNFLDVSIDPHIDNFLLEKDSEKIVIVDTEHFPTLVGLKGKPQFNNYFSWYYNLSKKCVQDMFFKSKPDRFGKES